MAFGRHVRNGSDDRTTPGVRRGDGLRGSRAHRSFVQLGYAEVRKLGIPGGRDEHVFGLDVAVKDAGRMRRRQSIGNPNEQLDHLAPRAPVRSSPRCKRSAVDQFGHEVLTAVELADVVDGEDMRVIQRRSCLRFTLEPAARRVIGNLV